MDRIDQFSNRRWIIGSIFSAVVFIYLVQLFSLQILNSSYKNIATKNVVRKVTMYPNRGLIYDRNDKLIVYNEGIYDLYVVPKQVESDIDKVKFCNLLDIDTIYFNQQLKKSKKYSYYKPSVFLKQITVSEFARFQEYLYQFPGFFGELRTIRKYPFGGAAHTLGYIGEVSTSQIDKDHFYKSGDYIGISGIEKIYETYLRGQRGTQHILVDNLNRKKGQYADGRFDTSAISGNSLISSLDIDLQLYGEKLMHNKKGAIVAIDPSTGEILALISSPSFDPNLLSGRRRGDNFNLLLDDTLKPLFNRAIQSGQNPPGSTFKPIQALIGLNEGTLSPNTGYKCVGYYSIGSLRIGCRYHDSPKNISLSLQHSCNTYYCNVFKNIIDQEKYTSSDESLDNWDEYLYSFGLGKKLGIDIPNEVDGLVPTPALYNKMYRKGSWKASTIISLSIGQGELGVTPLQMANMSAVIANRGYYFKPHIVREIIGDTTDVLNLYKQEMCSKVTEGYFEVVVEGMFETVDKGTARRSRIPDIEFCGKTGTSQNPHGEDHSLFIGFAPKHNPKIAIATLVENAGGGSKYAAPISSFMVEYYLTDSISKRRQAFEKTILETNLLNVIYKP